MILKLNYYSEMLMGEIYIVKLGGSLVSNSDTTPFDFDYIKKFSLTVRSYVDKGDKFAIDLGGGFMMRKLRDLAEKAGIKEKEQLHWIGATYNNVNAEITRAYMHNISNKRIIAYEDFYSNEKLKFEKGKSVIVGGGGRAGHSGDLDTLLLAKALEAKSVISLKNVDGVYAADPKKHPNAKRLDRISWQEYFKIIGFKKTHEPGGNYPIDPVAAQEAQKQSISFTIINGDDLKNFKNLLDKKKYIGTKVEG